MKKIIINGDFNNFEGNTLYINSLNSRSLNDLGRRELKKLYRDNEEIRRAAKRKAQEKHLEDIETYLYKTVSEIVKSVKKGDFNNVPSFESGSSTDKEITSSTQFLAYEIIESLKKLDNNFILSAFLENPTELFKDEEKDNTTVSYKVKDGRIIKILEEVI